VSDFGKPFEIKITVLFGSSVEGRFLIFFLLFVLVLRIFVLKPFLCLSVGFLVYNVKKKLLAIIYYLLFGA
jgi:hypothetical protein